MIFPRLQAIAEIGWSPDTQRTADSAAYADFLQRLAVDGQRLVAAGINFYRTPEVPWKDAVAPSHAGAATH
jgi:hexosaminidase